MKELSVPHHVEGYGLHPSINVYDHTVCYHVGGREVSFSLYRHDDAEEIFALIDRNRDHLAQYGENTSDKYRDLQSVQKSLQTSKPPRRYRFGIRVEGEMAGTVNVTRIGSGNDTWEIGYYLGEEYSGFGVMTQTVIRASQYVFDILAGTKVVANVHRDNIKSASVLERAGFQKAERQFAHELVDYELIK